MLALRSLWFLFVAAALAHAGVEDPATAFAEELAADPYFSKIDLVRDDRLAPLHVWVQPPKKADPAYVGRVVDGLGKVHEQVERAVVDLLGDAGTGPPEERFLPVVVLASRADFETYRKIDGPRIRWIYRCEGTYLRDPDVAVLFETPFEADRDPSLGAFFARATLLVQRLDERVDPRYSHLFDWFSAGTVDRVASSLGEREGRRSPGVDLAEGVRRFRDSLASARRREDFLHSFRVLATVRHSSAIRPHLRRTNGPGGYQEADFAGVEWAFLRQSTMAAWFLWETHEEEARAILRAWARGESPGQALARVLPDIAALDDEFLTWLEGEIRLADPGNAYDLRGPHVSRGAPASTVEAEPPPVAAETTTELALLAPSPYERAALAFLELARGATGPALAALEGLEDARPGDDAWAGWLARERARVEAWRELRDRCVPGLVEARTKLRLELGGERVRLRPIALEDGVLRFEENSAGIEELALEALDPRVVAQALPKEEDGWASVLPFVWTGDDRAKRLLRSDEPEVVLLEEDVERWHAELAEVRVALTAYRELMDLPRPEDQAGARAQRERIRAVLAQYGDDEAFSGRWDALEAWVRGRIANEAELLPLSQLVGGRVERLGEERIAVELDFDDDAAFRAFAPAPGLGDAWFPGAESMAGKVEPELRVVDGALRGLGRTSSLHVLTLGSPLRCAGTLTYVGQAEVFEWPLELYWGFSSGTGDGGLWLQGFYRHYVDVGGTSVHEGMAAQQVRQGVPYLVSMQQVDGELRTRSNGTDLPALPCAADVRGRFALIVNSGWPMQLDGVRLEGRFGSEERAATLAAWAARAEAEFWTGLR